MFLFLNLNFILKRILCETYEITKNNVMSYKKCICPKI